MEKEICREWIRKFATRRKTFNRKYGSYALKHKVEDWFGEYIPMEAFIAAAAAEGYRTQRIRGTPNVRFDMAV